VDDDVDIIESLLTYMREKGLIILGVGHDGDDAVKLVQKHQPQFILLDMKMPIFDGDYAIKKIKEISPKTKLIIITGHPDTVPKDQVDRIFQKPFSMNEIVEFIHKF